MGTSLLTAEFLYKHYVQDGKSTSAIAKMTGCFPTQVNRALKKFGISVRSKSQASRNFYEHGGENSRKGYEFTEEEKEDAAISAKYFWMSKDSKEARKKISSTSQEMWDKRTDEDRKATVARLHRACRIASQQGSKAQRKVAEILEQKYGYAIMTSLTAFAGIGDLEVDIGLPEHAIAIEVDGVTHYKEVYSDDRYERAQEADSRKNRILMSAGWSVIRVKLVCERYSVGSCLMVCEKLNTMIKEKKYKKNDVSYVDMK